MRVSKMREGAGEARASIKFWKSENKKGAAEKAAPFFCASMLYCTVNVVMAVTPLKVAVIVVVPVAMPVATSAALMVAAAVLLEVQVAEVVTVLGCCCRRR